MEFRPYLVSWNLTKKCNLSCPHCYIDSSNTADFDMKGTKNPELTTGEARFVIDELFRLNSYLMLVLSGGEPVLRSDIFEIVEYASRRGFITVMGSNGTLLTEQNLKGLKQAGLRGLGVSIDSTRAQSHDSFRGLEGGWERSTGAIRSARALGIEVQMDVTLTDRNVDEIEGFVDLGFSLSAKAVNFFFLVCTGRAMKTEITTSNYELALRRIAKFSSREKRLMVRARCAPHVYRLLHEEGVDIPEGTRGCLAGRHYLRIDPEGNVTPCPYMPVKVGNLKETSLEKIWEESPQLRQLREGTYGGRCGLCEYAEICGGCRARAFVEKDDLMDEDPLCSYTPSGRKKCDRAGGFHQELQWDEKAKERMNGIPPFMKGMIVRMIEAKAKERGMGFITSEFIDELKNRFKPLGEEVRR